MNYTRKSIMLPKSHVNLHPLRKCDKCNEQRAPEGGIQMSPTRWYCADCWGRIASLRRS